MSLGPFLFGAPLALAALIALPVIWWVLRATPPAPKSAALPSMRLLEDLEKKDETPARTPWWVLLLRFLAAALAIIGLSQPLYAPGAARAPAESGSLLIVMDDGWQSAARWSEMQAAAIAALDSVDRDADIHLLLTAPKTISINPSERLSRTQAEQRIDSVTPVAWSPDREDALERLTASGLRPDRILWTSDGLGAANGRNFAEGLAERGDLSVYAAPPRGALAITALEVEAERVSAIVRRAGVSGDEGVFVSALTIDGSPLATAEAKFETGAQEARAVFELPAAAFSRINRFALTSRPTAGGVWLWDSTDRIRRVGLVSAGNIAQPLLSDVHYVRKALEPFADISEGELGDLLQANPDAVILADVGQLQVSDAEALRTWIENGGALIRFAGPRLASQGDRLLPTPLRRASRALGGSLAWDEPQPLGAFPDTSPFAGLTPPPDARVTRQVLAEPAADLQAKTWARLEDGSPLVTADKIGSGSVILFHVTAGPDWSDLPYSKVFVDMLRRSIAAGRGEAASDATGAYTPVLVLDANGRLQTPSDTAAPLEAEAFADTIPSEAHPPGLYRGSAGSRALNTAEDYLPTLIRDWPSGAVLLGDAEAKSIRLAGPLLGLAGLLLALDLWLTLFLAGKIRLGGAARTTAAAAALAFSLPLLADAQTAFASEAETKALEAALEFRLAYARTGDAELDEATEAGLEGLARVLYLRSSVEPAQTHAVDIATDSLDLYPLIYYAVPDNAEPLSDDETAKLNAYLRGGGALVIDTRQGGDAGASGVAGLETLLAGLDAPPMSPVPEDHVLSRSFYLLDEFPGRYGGRTLWIESTAQSREQARGDGVSRLFIGDADWASAWAEDARGRPLFSVDGGQTQREMARRFGVNLVMYVLTGNYKEDQVHIPALLERLRPEDQIEEEDFELDALPPSILDGGPR